MFAKEIQALQNCKGSIFGNYASIARHETRGQCSFSMEKGNQTGLTFCSHSLACSHHFNGGWNDSSDMIRCITFLSASKPLFKVHNCTKLQFDAQINWTSNMNSSSCKLFLKQQMGSGRKTHHSYPFLTHLCEFSQCDSINVHLRLTQDIPLAACNSCNSPRTDSWSYHLSRLASLQPHSGLINAEHAEPFVSWVLSRSVHQCQCISHDLGCAAGNSTSSGENSNHQQKWNLSITKWNQQVSRCLSQKKDLIPKDMKTYQKQTNDCTRQQFFF